MFNSVTRYLWGAGGEENEADYGDTPEQDLHHVKEMPNPDDGDWVLVDTVDKENCCQTPHPHHHNHHSFLHATPHQQQHQSPDPAGSKNQTAPCDIELLDDAASLAHHLAVQSHKSSRVTVTECHMPNLEMESGDSSDFEENDSGPRPSSPESVFSACSGRSHATYRPKGQASEVWVIAPPPCFTGSQLGSPEPLASSPLENLLIEHPSMSVYYSVPSSVLPSSHPLLSLPAIADPPQEAGQALDEGRGTTVEDRAVDKSTNSRSGESIATAPAPLSIPVQRRLHPHQAALHPIQLSPDKLVQKTRIAQRHRVSKSQEDMSKKDCHRLNLVQTYSASTKRSNRHKLMRPSGCKSSRTSQRVH